MTATPLGKSSSIPALMKLGTAIPKLEGNQKKSAFSFAQAGNIESGYSLFKPKGHLSSSQQALEYALAMQKPNWRLNATEPREEMPPTEEDIVPKNMRYPRQVPSWLKHDKQVLRFYGFFQEAVTERPDENSRKRHVVIMYFMEDGTIRMSEPRVENSGIPQGSFLKRHRAPRDDGKGFIGPDDFRCGQEITIYGRTYYITGCDSFTRWFYTENGIELGDDETVAEDDWQRSYKLLKVAERGGLPSSMSAHEQKEIAKYMSGAPPTDKKLTQFLLNDRKVLRFKAYWDDHTKYGARIYMVVHYYLSDNTMEFNEAHCRNSGRYPAPVFMKRGPLKKKNTSHCVPGMLSVDEGRYMPEDLRVGGSIDMWGRKIVLYDCDDFTQKFYKDYMDVDQRVNVIDTSEQPVRHTKLAPPPHNGIGKEEDSLISCQMIMPKAPKVDLEKLMVLTGEVLRFEAKMVNGNPDDEMRIFVIGYYAHDDEIAIFEIPVRNSGHWVGKFADKRRMKNPDTRQRFTLQDLAVGRVVTMAGQPFLITRADERCLQFLEARPEEFPYADPVSCARRLSALKGEPELHDEAGIDPDRLKQLAEDVGLDLIDHEIITVLRRFGIEGPDGNPRVHGPRLLQAAM
eukprot:TRINITY_DN77958_c0_g1_i1.p1 TRINITY_DN77958_c0_g1~~TRINITY_DN77958_c0_g1_i1.p1  ORF type:complete len:626 (-),score=140.25 TRINITY_DN77958_c0_g1_i1:92-1969(-)